MLLTPCGNRVEQFYEKHPCYKPPLDILAELFKEWMPMITDMQTHKCKNGYCDYCPICQSRIWLNFAAGCDCHDVAVAITNSGIEGYQSWDAHKQMAKMVVERIYEMQIEDEIRKNNIEQSG